MEKNKLSTVAVDRGEQEKRQTEAWQLLLGMLGPSELRVVVYLILGTALILAGIGVMLVGLLVPKADGTSPDVFVTVLGVIALAGGVAGTTGVVVSVIGKKRKKTDMLAKLHASLDTMFARLPGVTKATLEWNDRAVKTVYFAEDAEILSFTRSFSKVSVVVFPDRITVDLSDDDSLCLFPDDLGDNYEALRQALMNKHESYQIVEQDEKGKYRLI